MGILEDLRYALRAVGKNRIFAAVAILSLGLGIGANTTVFALLNAILLRPLPVPQPDRLAAVYTLDPRTPGQLLNSYPNYKDYRDRNRVFSSLLLYSPILVNVTGHGEPQTLMCHIASGNYFETLGVHAAVGRTFVTEEDGSPGANPVVVISSGLWSRMFGGDPQITYRTIRLNNHEFKIIGVMSGDFRGLNSLFAAELWVPMSMYREVFPAVAAVSQRRALYFSVAGRLRTGVSLPQAEAGMQAVARSLEEEYPRENGGRSVKLYPAAEVAIAPKTRGTLTNSSSILLIVSALVLFIACANVANLLLVRAAGRSKEIALRLALGANRWQLMRQLLVESLLLSAAGGILGLLVARWARDLLWSMRPPDLKYAALHLNLDPLVLAYSIGLSVTTGIVFGLVPAIRATHPNLAVDLKERAGQAAMQGKWNARDLLVTIQVAFSLVALVGAGLFIRSLLNADEIDPGFDAAHLGCVSFNVGEQGYTEARGREFQRRALELAAAVPGVNSVTLSKDTPFTVGSSRTVLLQGQDNSVTGQGRVTLTSVVAPGYFRTTRIPLLRGRDFSPLDAKGAPRVAIVNEAAAKYFWPAQEAVGKVIQFAGENLPVEIVGVARNANYRAIAEPPDAMVYLSLEQYYFPYAAVYIHSSGDPDAALALVRQQMRTLDPNLVLDIESARATVRASLWAQRLSADLLAVFGTLGLALATIGIYGVIAYSVHQRVREVGIRMALGATRGDVQRLIVGQGMRLVAIGVVIGTLIALATSRNVKSMLFAVSERDAATFILVPAVLALVAVFACWIPATRATRIDPGVALRDQ